tara:strand:- start:1593 stop:3425 length:1833 start_codon:yes stop_codon:yes gene_type:complete
MATHDYVIANASGAAVRADLNNALAAIVTNNSGSSEPGTTYSFQWWADTNTNQLKLRNAANDDWIVIQELDGTMLMENGSAASPGLAFASDTDTGLFRPAANQLGIATSGVERVEFGTTEVVFNDSGANVDLRVEGDAEANLLKIDAGNDRIGIAESAPGTLVEIGSTAPYVTLKNSTEEDTDGGRESRLIFEGEQSGGEISALAQVEVSHDGTADDEKGKLVISTNDGSDGASPTTALTISADQTVAIADNLTVKGNQYPTAGALSNRNLIINGAQTVSQRGTSTASVTSSGYHAVDRFHADVTTAGTWTFSQSTTTPDEFANSFKLDCTTAKASPDVGTVLIFNQRVEGFNLQSLKKGTSAAESVTLSFWVRSNKTGTYIAELRDNDNSRAISKTYSISSANTWEHKTITFPGDTTGAFDNDNGLSLYINWWLAAGSNFTSGTLSTSWASITQANRAVGVVNLADSTDNEWYITGVQLEVGEKATPFEHRSYGDELVRCQRYFEKSYNQGTTPGAASTSAGSYTARDGTASAVVRYYSVNYKVTKRAVPTVVIYNPQDGASASMRLDSTSESAATSSVGDCKMMVFSDDSTVPSHFGASFHYTLEAEL